MILQSDARLIWNPAEFLLVQAWIERAGNLATKPNILFPILSINSTIFVDERSNFVQLRGSLINPLCLRATGKVDHRLWLSKESVIQ